MPECYERNANKLMRAGLGVGLLVFASSGAGFLCAQHQASSICTNTVRMTRTTGLRLTTA